jgi:hypothetical protein
MVTLKYIATMSLSSMIHLHHYLSLPYLVVVLTSSSITAHITYISVLISQLPTSSNLCDQLDSMVYDLRWLSPSLVDLTVSDRCVAYQNCWCTTCLYKYVIASSSGGTGTGNNYFFYFYCKV